MVMADRDDTWCVSLCSSLDSLRRSSAFLDVIISAEDGRVLRAHTCVLAAASDVFRTELSVHCHQLHIPGISGQTWEAVLHFVYTGEIQVTNAQEIANLLEACHRLGLTKLAKMCGEFDHNDKTPASPSSKHFEIPVVTEESVTHLSSGADGDERTLADSIHNDSHIPQPCVTLYTETGPLQEDIQITVVDIPSQTHNSTSAAIQLDSLDIQSLLTEEIQLDTNTVELDADAIVEEVSLGMFLKKEELDADGQTQNHEQITAGGDLDSSNDDKAHVIMTPACNGRKRRGKYKVGAKEYTCEVCGKAFSHLSRLKFHSNIHTGDRPYACTQCGKTFNHTSNLARHERTHTGVRPHACPECGRDFQRASDMAVHVQRVHCTEKPFACDLCEKEFSMESDLKSHMYQHMEVKPYKCAHCDKSFGKMVNLVTHERRHTGERPFACPVCAMTFKDSSNLARHRRIHSGIKPFECSICGKAFLRKADLIGHQRIHTEEKPYVCPVCGKAFTFRTSLDMHARLHTGERPYMCAVCGKTFSRNCNLLDHHTTHTGDKPFQCGTCGRNFATKTKLASHGRVHSEAKPFECHLCGKRYRWASVLKKHVMQCSS